MYSLPQEVEVWYIIPAIRREFAKVLTANYGLTFDKAGELLGISKAAVSQYLGNKRASKVKFPKKIKKEIELAAKNAIKDKNAMKEILKILNLIKKSGCCCNLCKKYNPGIIKHCKMNPQGE